MSCSILLNDPEEFEGGDFEYWTKKNPERVIKKGSILFFLHFSYSVTKGIKGERKFSYVDWWWSYQ